MRLIHKTGAVVIKDNKLLCVRKVGKDKWTFLGGKMESGETEEECLLREIKEEFDCGAKIIKKIGDFEDEAMFDPGSIVKVSNFLVELEGDYKLIDPELEEYKFIGKEHDEKLGSIIEALFPILKKEGLIN